MIVRHVSCSGSFLDTGVKKLAIALPNHDSAFGGHGASVASSLLDVLELAFCLVGGGDTDASLASAFLFMPVGTVVGGVHLEIRLKGSTLPIKGYWSLLIGLQRTHGGYISLQHLLRSIPCS